jgi:hypothetical protein
MQNCEAQGCHIRDLREPQAQAEAGLVPTKQQVTLRRTLTS